MSIDRLQERIRKTKNPSMIDLTVCKQVLPECLLAQTDSWLKAYLNYAQAMMESLRGVVPALRFRYNGFAIYGPDGLQLLYTVTKRARKLGFYILLDVPQSVSAAEATEFAAILLDDESPVCFDGMIVSSYIGTDGVKPYAKYLKEKEKSLFVTVRSPNKSASELQDLLTGSRSVHVVMAEKANKLAIDMPGRCGYSQIGCLAAATAPDSLRILRSKYQNMFILIDGYDYSNANAKYCSNAFDTLGHGAIVCAGQGITGAWQEAECSQERYLELALEATERMKKNLSKYITVL